MKQKYFWTIIPIISFLFLNELIIDDKIPLASDMVAHEPIKKWIDSTSEFPHWFPNLFSGMPSYGGYIYTPGHPLKIVLDFLLFNTGVKLWFYLSIGGLGLLLVQAIIIKSWQGVSFPGLFLAQSICSNIHQLNLSYFLVLLLRCSYGPITLKSFITPGW
jgi:hypothetical protein